MRLPGDRKQGGASRTLAAAGSAGRSAKTLASRPLFTTITCPTSDKQTLTSMCRGLPGPPRARSTPDTTPASLTTHATATTLHREEKEAARANLA